MKIKKLNILILIISGIITFNCSEEFDINQFKTDENNANLGGDTVYIQLSPAWEGFNNPQDIIIGREPFIYVADTDNDRIVMMNLDGKILGTRTIMHPVAIAQDYQLNLIVCGQIKITSDTLTQVLSAVYKFDLASVKNNIETAPADTILPRSSDYSKPLREYTGVTVFYDNSFFIARRGPNNGNIDPDNSILHFVKKTRNDGTKIDSLIGRVALLNPLSSGIPSANQISSITSFQKRNYNIIFSLAGNNSFKVQWLKYIQSPDFTGYISQLAAGESALLKPNRFDQPEDVTLDDVENIFVTDIGKDSIFKFNPYGDELESFGGEGVLNNPYAVAFFDKTLYVADAGTGRILRFVLSTDIK